MGESPSPSTYREKNPYHPPPAEYKPPSLLAEHKGLAILFAVIVAAFAFYCLRAPHAPAKPAPRASSHAQPIFIEPLPDKDSR
jgi:hypothetical protein